MDSAMNAHLNRWRQATGAAPWGVQRAFKTVLEAVRDNDTHLVYGRDYSGNFPCLVNTVAPMLSANGGQALSPSAHFSAIVGAFDSLNKALREVDVNTDDNLVSPLAADIMLRHYGALNPEPELPQETLPYMEPTDEDLMTSWLAANEADAVKERTVVESPVPAPERQ